MGGSVEATDEETISDADISEEVRIVVWEGVG
jgi:hypothetical protein